MVVFVFCTDRAIHGTYPFNISCNGTEQSVTYSHPFSLYIYSLPTLFRVHYTVLI